MLQKNESWIFSLWLSLDSILAVPTNSLKTDFTVEMTPFEIVHAVHENC